MKEKKKTILLRLAATDLEAIKRAAKADNRSVNQWVCLSLKKSISLEKK